MTEAAPAIRIAAVTKRYGRTLALDGVSFDVWLEATAQIAHRRIPEDGRDAVAESLGAPAGSWAAAEAAWRARQSHDPRLVERFSSNLVHRLGDLQRENPSRA